MAELNDVQLMFCIQICASDTFDRQVACTKGTDYYPSLRADHASTSKVKDAAGAPKP